MTIHNKASSLHLNLHNLPSPPPKKIPDLLLVMKNCMTTITVVHVLMKIKIQEQHVYYNWFKLNMYSTA